MAKVSVGNGDAEIICAIHELVEEEKKRRSHPYQNPPSIYLVPDTLRNVSQSSFNPRVIAIGPLHEKGKKLQKMERNKATYMLDFFCRLESSSDETMSKCVHLVHAQIDRIKACYAVDMDYDDAALAKMMVVDACFILELILRPLNDKKRKGDLIFDNLVLTYNVKRDLILLENQIPFFVLKDIFECTVSKFKPTESLTKLVLTFLSDIIPFDPNLIIDNARRDTNCDHILGLLQESFQPAVDMTSIPTILPSYSAVELARAGVKFEPNDDKKWVLAMEFKSPRTPCFAWSWGKPTFRMPVLGIEDSTESVLRNLIAYEQCSPLILNYITSYACALDMLVDAKEDVIKMTKSEVLVNNLGSSEDAANMINSICKEVVLKEFSYQQQWEQMNSYYNGYWPKNIAWLRRTYFNSPWNFIALIAAIILFALTVLQTIFTIKPL